MLIVHERIVTRLVKDLWNLVGEEQSSLYSLFPRKSYNLRF